MTDLDRRWCLMGWAPGTYHHHHSPAGHILICPDDDCAGDYYNNANTVDLGTRHPYDLGPAVHVQWPPTGGCSCKYDEGHTGRHRCTCGSTRIQRPDDPKWKDVEE